MKQTIDTRVLVLIVAAGIVLLAGIGTWVWTRPTATPVVGDGPAAAGSATAGGAGARSGRSRQMLESHQPTAQDRRDFEDFKRKFPNATVK
jgi:hypothetical protein